MRLIRNWGDNSKAACDRFPLRIMEENMLQNILHWKVKTSSLASRDGIRKCGGGMV